MWLNYGDANTKYFHLKTIQRRSQTRVITLKDDTGLWLNGEALTHHIYTAFKKLFQASTPTRCASTKINRSFCPNSPFLNQTQNLTRTPPLEEIFQTLKGLTPVKTPGPDGYHALFFQTHWVSLGPSIVQVIQDIFTQHMIPPSWSITNLVLISKIAHPELITQFRPISLYNTLYKLVSRIIVQRLKPYMAEVINPYQAGFVPGRRTSDNIIIVQEVIKTLISRRGQTGYVALKLDLEKAYDRLKWHYIQDTLEFFQLPPTLITLIMNIISSTRFHVLWNGSPLPEVVPSRGLRQGDPLSPYLFILCLERLSIQLTEAVQEKHLHPISFWGRVHLSHLFFADDIFLFTRATARDCRNLG